MLDLPNEPVGYLAWAFHNTVVLCYPAKSFECFDMMRDEMHRVACRISHEEAWTKIAIPYTPRG